MHTPLHILHSCKYACICIRLSCYMIVYVNTLDEQRVQKQIALNKKRTSYTCACVFPTHWIAPRSDSFVNWEPLEIATMSPVFSVSLIQAFTSVGWAVATIAKTSAQPNMPCSSGHHALSCCGVWHQLEGGIRAHVLYGLVILHVGDEVNEFFCVYQSSRLQESFAFEPLLASLSVGTNGNFGRELQVWVSLGSFRTVCCSKAIYWLMNLWLLPASSCKFPSSSMGDHLPKATKRRCPGAVLPHRWPDLTNKD